MTIAPRNPLIKPGAPFKVESTPGRDTGEKPLHRSLPDDYDDFRKRIIIRREALDVCIEEQAQVFLEVCERHVDALSIYAEIKDRLAREDADYARTLRAEAKGERITDSTVAAEVAMNPEHIRLTLELAAQKKRVDQWAALREAFDQRRGMLRELVGLYMSGYYGASGTVGPRNAVRDALAATAKEALAQRRKER